MEKMIRRVHTPKFKAKVAVEAIKEQKTIPELSSTFSVHASQVTKWKKQAIEGLDEVFDKGTSKSNNDEELIQSLYEQIGKLKVENDWLKKKVGLIER